MRLEVQSEMSREYEARARDAATQVIVALIKEFLIRSHNRIACKTIFPQLEERMKALQQRKTLPKADSERLSNGIINTPKQSSSDVPSGESRIADEARERQKEFDASAYAHRQRMILDLQVIVAIISASCGSSR
jgi:hypothetical protein